MRIICACSFFVIVLGCYLLMIGSDCFLFEFNAKL